MNRTRKLVFLSLLISLGLALHVIESNIPFPVPIPGAKIGLANIITLLTLILFGFRESLAVALLRCIMAAAVSGSVSNLAFSLSGALFSIVSMGTAYRYSDGIFSLIGISIIGAEAHNLAQVITANIIFKNIGFFFYLPVLLLIGIVTGCFVGLSTLYIENNLTKNMIAVQERN